MVGEAANGVAGVVVSKVGVVLGCTNRGKVAGGGDRGVGNVPKPTVSNRELGEVVGRRGDGWWVTGVCVVAKLEDVNAGLLYEFVKSRRSRHGQTGGGDA